MIICHCFAISDSKIKKYDSLKEVQDYTLAGTCCGRCIPAIIEILEEKEKEKWK